MGTHLIPTWVHSQESSGSWGFVFLVVGLMAFFFFLYVVQIVQVGQLGVFFSIPEIGFFPTVF